MKRSIYKAKGGVIRVELESDAVIKKIKITGDFFIFPEESIEELEKELIGTGTGEEELLKVIESFFENIDAHGIEPADIVSAIKGAL